MQSPNWDQERNTSSMQEQSQRQVWWFMSVKVKLKRKKKQKTPNRKLPRRGAPNLQPQHWVSPRTLMGRCEASGEGVRQLPSWAQHQRPVLLRCPAAQRVYRWGWGYVNRWGKVLPLPRHWITAESSSWFYLFKILTDILNSTLNERISHQHVASLDHF